MKKLMSVLLTAVLMIIHVSSCGAAETGNKKIYDNVLIVDFSATGNTKGIAEHISNILGADMYDIVPAVPYTSADLDYNSDCRANREQNDNNARPEISSYIENINKYDVIFVGYPIWWGKLPKIMYTFFDSYDFSDKTIVPFCTSGSSGISASVDEIKAIEPKAAVDNGRRFSGGSSEETVKEWIDTLDLPEPSKPVRPEITFNGAVAKVENAPDGSTLIAAFYDNSRLTSTQIERGSGTITVDFSEQLPEADRIKVFLWDLKSIYPLCDAREISGGKTDEPMSYDTLYIHVNNNTIEAVLEDNESASALVEKLKNGDISVDMHDYGDFEKVGSFGFTLPRNDTQITTEPGDIILYSGNQLTIHYGSNSWSYTRLATVKGMTGTELKSALGDGNVTVTLSLK